MMPEKALTQEQAYRLHDYVTHYGIHSGECSVEAAIRLLAEKEAELADLRKRVAELQACHDSELGVCFQHCDEVKERDERVKELQAIVDKLRAIVEPLNFLRYNEGASVLIPCDNPDFVSSAGCAVEVRDAWTGWKLFRFEGDDLAGALATAREAAEKDGE